MVKYLRTKQFVQIKENFGIYKIRNRQITLYIFVLVDYYSRWFEMEVTKVITSEKITKILTKMFVTHGLPVSIQTDNGPQFISEHFSGFHGKLGE